MEVEVGVAITDADTDPGEVAGAIEEATLAA
jgi:hypothetical protein